MAGDTGTDHRQWSVSSVFGTGKRTEIDRARPDLMRNVRRRVLQKCTGVRCGWRRFRRRRIVISHPVRFKGLSHSSPRQNARVGDHAGASIRE